MGHRQTAALLLVAAVVLWTTSRVDAGPGPRRLVNLDGSIVTPRKDWVGVNWLHFLLAMPDGAELTVETLSHDAPPPDDEPIVVVQRPKWKVALTESALARWSSAGAAFYLLHVGDEFCDDSIAAYLLPGCRGVLRVRSCGGG